MMLQPIFDKFVNGSPVSVMVRGILEHVLPAQEIDDLFKQTAERQYTKELLFSSVVELMSTVVCRMRPSVHAAYQAAEQPLGVSV
jgi:hypothetical protein